MKGGPVLLSPQGEFSTQAKAAERQPGRDDRTCDVAVIGGGVIGLSIAWRAASRGMDVVVVDPEPGRGASWAAAGMLAPVTEVHYGEEALLALNMASCGRWPAFVEDLEAASGRDVGYRRCGTLLVAVDEGDRSWVEELFAFERSLGLEVEWLTARRARELEPNLSPGIRAGMRACGDHQVDNRLLVEALAAAAALSGTRFIRVRARAVVTAAQRVEGVLLEGGRLLEAPSVVLAAGSWSAEIADLPSLAVPPVRPVKGQILRLSTPPGPHLLEGSVRGIVNGKAVYLVPRANGSVVLGATVEEMGFDTSVTVGAVYEMLRDAHRVVPGVSELHLTEAMAGLRPGSPDNAPMIGAVTSCGVDGLVVATGHYRNGVLLTPLTCEAVSNILAGSEPPSEVLPFTPSRFEVPSWTR